MTVVLDPPEAAGALGEAAEDRPGPLPPPPAPEPDAAPAVKPERSRASRLRLLFVGWLVAVVAGMALVMYGVGPMFQQRDQHRLLTSYRAAIEQATNEAGGLPGVEVPTKPAPAGDPVGILEIPAVRMQQVVVEGVSSSDTRSGPGHVPGTAGLGQPGNSVVVGRKRAFGGPFSSLHNVRHGDQILVTTTQGQTVYEVDSVEHTSLGSSAAIDGDYGPTDDDQLTLVTSDSSAPWNKSSALMVKAKMKTQPFTRTPQGGRSDAETGIDGDQGAVSSVILALVAYGLALGGAVVIYRRMRPRTAYLLTLAPLLAMTIIAAETLSRVFPAWM